MWFCGTLRIRSGCLRVRDAMFSHALRAPAAGTLIARLLRQTEGSHRCARVDVRVLARRTGDASAAHEAAEAEAVP